MMKKVSSIVFAAFFMLAILLLLPGMPTKAAGPLDEIKSYVITVDMRDDGTMNIKYHLDWQVLDDTSEGPLTWVKIGIPNYDADNVQALSQNISDIEYLFDNGSYVRTDFDRPYHAGEAVAFDFSIHQSAMYDLDYSENTFIYTFVPGWFDEIRVDSLKILWNKADVASSNATGTQGEYLTWETSLEAGERYETTVTYPFNAFITSDNMQANGDSDRSGSIIGTVVFIIVILILWILSKTNRYRGGFGSNGTTHTHHACACAGGCACACACACAGGGRAGCSAKNFYGAKIPLGTLHDKLSNT